MALPIGFIAPLILGAGFGAKMLDKKLSDDRENAAKGERVQAIIAGLQGGQPQPQPAAPASIHGAMQPTATPQIETPSAEPPLVGAGPQPEMRPGELTEVPILPTSQILSPGNAPFYPKGVSYDEDGNINVQMARDTGQLDAQWFQQFQNNLKTISKEKPGITPLEADFEAMARTVNLSKRMPSTQALQMLDPTRREQLSEQIYWSGVLQLKNSPDIRRAITLMAREGGVKMTDQALSSAVQHYALRAVTNEMGGYMPEEVRGVLINLEGPPISAELAKKAYQMFGIVDPREITQQQAQQVNQALKQEKLTMTEEEATAQALGAESAADIIEAQATGSGGSDPTSRAARRKEELGKVDLSLTDRRPISRELAQALQVPVGTTMGEVKEKGLIQVPLWVQKNRSDVWDALDQLEELHSLAQGIITADPNFFSLVAQAARLKAGRFTGTDVNSRVYTRISDGLLSVMARNIASERGVLNEGDIVRAKKLKSGDFSSAEEMEAVFASMKKLMTGRLANAEKAVLPQRVKEKKATKRWNPKTKKLEVIK